MSAISCGVSLRVFGKGFGWCARGDAGRGTAAKDAGAVTHLGGTPRSASSICRPRHPSPSPPRARAPCAPREAHRPGGHGRVGGGAPAEASARHRRRHHHRHLHRVSLIPTRTVRSLGVLPSLLELLSKSSRAGKGGCRAASRRRMKILLSTRCQNPRNFHRNPTGIPDPVPDTPVRTRTPGKAELPPHRVRFFPEK